MLQNHSAVLRGFRSKQEMDRKKFEQILQKKKQNRNGSNIDNADDEDDAQNLENSDKINATGSGLEVCKNYAVCFTIWNY